MQENGKGWAKAEKEKLTVAVLEHFNLEFDLGDFIVVTFRG